MALRGAILLTPGFSPVVMAGSRANRLNGLLLHRETVKTVYGDIAIANTWQRPQ
jgi:hypothetical protein